jgi:hypothetical protein
MTSAEPFKLVSRRLGCLPIVNFLFDRMGLAEQLQTYLPSDDPRLRLAPATVIATVVRNIVAGHRPVYALNDRSTPSTSGRPPTIRPSSGSPPERWNCSTTTGSAGCWTGSSTPTGPA